MINDDRRHMCIIIIRVSGSHGITFFFSFLPEAKVPSTNDGSQRAIPHIFRPGFAEKSMMANVTLPMGESVAFKKLLRKKAHS